MKITNLKKKIGDFSLEIDNMIIEEKKIHCIVGGNGSGKTTLGKLIMGVMKADGGEIDYGLLQASDITMTSQRPYLLHSSVYDNIIYPLKIRKIQPNDKEIEHWLEKYELLSKKNQYARSLSSGERQKLSFIRAVIFNPQLIIIDETLSNLDPDTVSMMKAWIKEKQKTDPVTYVIISHQVRHVLDMCDMVHVMHKGKLLESGPCREVLLGSTKPEIAQFMEDYIVRTEKDK